MPSPISSLISFIKKPNNNLTIFKDFYKNWHQTLAKTLLPLLRRSLSSPSTATTTTLLSSHLSLLLHHLLYFFDALDLAASSDPFLNLPHLLFPSFLPPLLSPFLFLGHLHPYLFTNLLRSFLSLHRDDLDRSFVGFSTLDRPWPVTLAWRDPPKRLAIKIEQIDCGLRLMVPALADRAKKAQAGFVGRVAGDWVGLDGRKDGVDVEGAMRVEMEELVSVFVDANRLRRSVISEIVGALDVYQGALFLEGLAQFLVGFQDSRLLREFERCKGLIGD